MSEASLRLASAWWAPGSSKPRLGPSELGEFFLLIEVESLAQLDRAFSTVSPRTEPIESIPAAVNHSVCDLRSALFRDFPDEQRTPEHLARNPQGKLPVLELEDASFLAGDHLTIADCTLWAALQFMGFFGIDAAAGHPNVLRCKQQFAERPSTKLPA
jgi:hypothetical protein